MLFKLDRCTIPQDFLAGSTPAVARGIPRNNIKYSLKTISVDIILRNAT